MEGVSEKQDMKSLTWSWQEVIEIGRTNDSARVQMDRGVGKHHVLKHIT